MRSRLLQPRLTRVVVKRVDRLQLHLLPSAASSFQPSIAHACIISPCFFICLGLCLRFPSIYVLLAIEISISAARTRS